MEEDILFQILKYGNGGRQSIGVGTLSKQGKVRRPSSYTHLNYNVW